MSKHFGDSGKKNLPFKRKKPASEPGSGKWKHVLFLLFYFSELIEDFVYVSFTNICSLKMIEDDN